MPIDPIAPPTPLFRSLGIAASGLDAQRLRMDVAAANIANADVTRTPEGGAYRKKVVQLQTATQPQFAASLRAAMPPAAQLPTAETFKIQQGPMGPLTPISTEFGVAVRGIGESTTEGARVYEPGHPDADAEGYVTRSNVRVTDEIVDLMDARRLFEANATVFQVAKAMLRRAIDI
jgi:flagellar basal-body rod protein FlgC